MRRCASGLAVAVLALSGLGLLGQGLWIPTKALAAQWLLERAWTRTRTGEPASRPWPWADTWPVARIEVPRLGVDWVVLAGASGSSLAFGPGHWSGTALPGRPGHSVIAGHRDTHFGFLREIEPGDRVVITTPEGTRVTYRMDGARVVHERDGSPLVGVGAASLALVTCFPFDDWVPGGPGRFAVWGARVDAPRGRNAGAPLHKILSPVVKNPPPTRDTPEGHGERVLAGPAGRG